MPKATTPPTESEVGADVMAQVAALMGVKPVPPSRKPALTEEEKEERAAKRTAAETADTGDDDGEADTGDDADADATPAPKKTKTKAPAAEAEDDDEADDDQAGDDDENDAADDDEKDDGGDDEQDLDADEKAERQATAKLVATLKEASPELRNRVQGIINKRIGEVRARTTGDVEAARAEVTALEARVSELTTEAEEIRSRGGAPLVVPGLHPLFLADSAAAIDTADEGFQKFLDWADDHRDGYEGDGSKENPSFTAEEIRARAREVRRERERIVPQARELLKARAADEAAVRSLYPAAFDAKSPDSRAYRAVFKTVPELRRLPNPHTLALQMLLGEKALAAHRAAKTTKAAPLPKKVPRAPGQGGGGKGSRVVHSDGKAATSDAVRNYTKGGGSRDALVAAAAAYL